MHAMQLSSPGDIQTFPLHFVDREIPFPGTGEILIEISTCGVCHTDLHIVEGDIIPPSLPLIPGHQIVGQVVGCGEGVSYELIGRRVGVPWVFRTCRECSACQRGEENLCVTAKFTGFHYDGGFAEYVVVPERSSFDIPKSISDREAAPLLCAGIIGYRSLRCVGLQAGERLGLIGFGASAHLAIQVALSIGCKVSVFTRSENHQRHAQNLGAEWAGKIEEGSVDYLDRIIIFAPAGELVPLALKKLRPGGTLAINAIYMSRIPSLQYELLYGERSIRSVTNATRQDGVEFLALAEKIGIRANVTMYGLTEANQALQHLKASLLVGEAVLDIRG